MSIKDDYFVQAVARDDYVVWLLKKHYAHRIPSVSFAYGLYDTQKTLQGICTFGQPPSDGVKDCCGEAYKNNTIELNRLIKNDSCRKNVQSWFVSQCFVFLPKPMVVVSYSDPNYGHFGYTYQALNFLYTGTGGEPKEYIYEGHRYNSRHIKDYWFAPRGFCFDKSKTIDQNFLMTGGIINKVKPKFRYVIFLGSRKQKKDMLNRFKWKVLPYPKGENKRYDASYEPKTQDLLF